MTDFLVKAEGLLALAGMLGEVAHASGKATNTSVDIKTQVWASYGVACQEANYAFADAEIVRKEAGHQLKNDFLNQSANLSTANKVYDSVDAKLAENVRPTGR